MDQMIIYVERQREIDRYASGCILMGLVGGDPPPGGPPRKGGGLWGLSAGLLAPGQFGDGPRTGATDSER